MKIVYSGLEYTNYQKELGNSFEYENFYASLKKFPGAEIIHFPYDRILVVGKRRWNEELKKLILEEKADIFFAFMFTDELDMKILDEVKKFTISLAWFSDDHWRFHNYSRWYASHFSFAITTYSGALAWYRSCGIENVIRSQWAVNPDEFKSLTTPVFEFDVSFVGGWARLRDRIISALQSHGISVDSFGNGWARGRVGRTDMLRIFSASKINLGLNPAPGFWNVNSLGRLFFRRSMDGIVPDMHFYRNFEAWLRRGIPQIKARHFEIPACGGFLMSGPADDIHSYFELGKEIVVYNSLPDLRAKIRYYLEHDAERRSIASAGQARVMRDHTYEKRFREIFERIGIKNRTIVKSS